MIRYHSRENIVMDTVVTVLLLLLLITCVLPLLNVVALSFSGKEAAIAGKVSFWPVNITLSSYEYLTQDARFFRSFIVSCLRVVLGGSINLLMCLTMGYSLSQEKETFPSRNRYMWLLIFTMLFNGGLVPWYFSIKYTGLMDSIWALVIPGAVPVFNVILLMNFFRNLPKPIRESAMLDGCGEFKILVMIYIPLAMPAIATVTLFSIVAHWNNFFDGMLLINNSNNVPLQTYIQSLTIRTSDLSTMGMTAEQMMQRMSQRTFNAAKIVISTVPILAIYPFMQRYFITGITLGSVKG
ncbi:MAG: carbohydrate ABC transporter permease [Eubacteriales bacterium]|nr:carbohydrate ABC transporter permease [Eubacteriales bacterium]